MKKLQKY